MTDTLDINKLDLAGTKAKGKRPYFLESKQTEQVMSIVMSLAMELSVTRERLASVECLLEDRGLLDREQLNSYQPDKSEAERRSADTQEFLARILRIMQQDKEEMQRNDPTMEEVQEKLTKS